MLFVIELLCFSILIIVIEKARNIEKSKAKKIDENFKSECEKKVIDEKINC